jgi:hypothetical protein
MMNAHSDLAPIAAQPEHDVANIAQLFKAVMTITADRTPDIIEHLTASRNLPLLEAILSSGEINGDVQYVANLASAMAPLLGAGEDEPARIDFVSRWLKALDLDTPSKLGSVLPTLELMSDFRTLLHTFGADPLAPAPYKSGFGRPGLTVLGHAVLSGHPSQAIELLSSLAKDGRPPLANLAEAAPMSAFRLIADCEMHSPSDSNIRNSSVVILKNLAKTGRPAAWEREAGNALLEYLAEKKAIDHRSEMAILEMLGVARFDEPADWLKIMCGGELPHYIPTTLNNKAELGVRVVENMKRDGASPDTLLAAHAGNGSLAIMPWLHAAIADDRVEIVEALLDAGCDCGARTHVVREGGSAKTRPVERDAFAVAQPGSTSAKLLLSWKAKQSIGSVLDKALAGRPQP